MGKLCCSFSPRPFVAGLRLPENLGSCLNAASQSACAGNPEPAGPADQREDNPRFRKEEGRSEVAVGPIWVRQWKNPAQKAAQCAGRWKGNVQLGRGAHHTPCRAAAGPSAAQCTASAAPAACAAAGQGGLCLGRGHGGSLSPGVLPCWCHRQIPSHGGEESLGGSKQAAALCRAASHWQGPLAFPTCLKAPLGLQASARTSAHAAESPGWPEGDRTVLWPPPARIFCEMAAAGAISWGTRACPCACQPAG